ncbi:MAG: amidase [Vicinamibacterales bacterium]
MSTAPRALVDRSATELRHLVATRQVSARELLRATLARIAQVNPVVNAVVTLNERAEIEAQAVDDALARGEAPGALCGLPVGIKDVTPVAGVRTTYGSPLFVHHVPDRDAAVVTRLRQAGAVIVGKTNCPEFAAGGNTFNEVFGRTVNPWDTARSAGGSTGGGAAALATGMIALAEGTDLGGSLRIPASFCGVCGIRPSVGLVPTAPTGWAWDTLQVSGPMGRTPADVALMLQAMAGASPAAPLGQPIAGRDFAAAVARGVRRGLRVAYAPDPAGIGIDADVERVCRAAVATLGEAGAVVAEHPLDLAFVRPAFLALRGLWFVTQLHGQLALRDRFGPNVAGNIRAGLETSVAQLAEAEQVRGRLWDLCRDLFSGVDCVVTPCMAVPPFPVTENYPATIAGRPMATYVDWIAPTFVWSMTGLPVAAVPAGRDAHGLPVGLQIVGPPLGEEVALAVAAAVAERCPIGDSPLSRSARNGDGPRA